MSRGEEFAYHALVRLAQIRTSGENRLNFGCVARLIGPRCQGQADERDRQASAVCVSTRCAPRSTA